MKSQLLQIRCDLVKLNFRRASQVIVIALCLASIRASAIDMSFPPEPTEQERQFVSVVATAISNTNINSLIALDYFGNADTNVSRAVNRMFYRETIQMGCTNLALKRVDPATSTEQKSLGGTTIRENLPVHWILVIAHPSPMPGGSSVTELKVGLFDGKMKFTQPVESP